MPLPPGAAYAAGPNAAVPAAALFESAEDLKLPPGERLLKLLQKSGNVALGAKDDAPLMFALVIPGLEPCKIFWQRVREAVFSDKVTLRLVPAGLAGGEDERAAAVLLRSADPLHDWDRYEHGDAAALAGVAEPASLDQARNNAALIDRWRLPVAPYLVYRARDGQVKVVEGIPADINAVIADARPAPIEATQP